MRLMRNWNLPTVKRPRRGSLGVCVLRRMDLRGQDGLAMIVALLVTFVVLMLSVGVVAQSIHSLESSSLNERRLESVNAAEAGINSVMAMLQQNNAAALLGTNCVVDQSFDGGVGFSVDVAFYDLAGNPLTCAQASTTTPSQAAIRSTGSAGASSRTMESLVRLTPNPGAFGAAVVSDVGLNLINNLTLNGNVGQDANIFVNSGNATINNNGTVNGSVFVPGGTLSLRNNTIVNGSVWSNGALSVQNNAKVNGNVTSSIGSITMQNNALVSGNAAAAGSITLLNLATIGGSQRPNTSSPTPPSAPLPQISWIPGDWTAAGYAIQTYTTCAAAQTALTNLTTVGNVVVRIASVCQFLLKNNDTISFNGDLAIVTDGSIKSQNNARWQGVGGTRKLMLISTYRSGLNCSTGSYNVQKINNASFPSAEVLFYSPCTVEVGNNSGFSGQIIAGTASISNNFTMNFRPVVAPGDFGTTGYQQDIAYFREVSSTG